jgi:predicted dehydrogenase
MRLDRRSFLGQSAAAAFVAGATRRSVAASEKVVLAAIGLGGRQSALIRGFLDRPDVEYAYLCDIHPTRNQQLAQEIASSQGKTPQRVTDYRHVLDDKSVDAVVVATPDHWHAPLTVFAC